MGIASEGVISLREGRRFLGAELKASYYEQAVKNLIEAATHRQTDLFDGSTHEPASPHEPDPITIDDAP
jgi:hypothetical protein